MSLLTWKMIFFILFVTSCLNIGTLLVYLCCYSLRMENANEVEVEYRFGHGFYLAVSSAVLYFLTGFVSVYHATCSESAWEAPQRYSDVESLITSLNHLINCFRPTAVESEVSHGQASLAKSDMNTEIPAYLVRQTRTPRLVTLGNNVQRFWKSSNWLWLSLRLKLWANFHLYMFYQKPFAFKPFISVILRLNRIRFVW